MVPHDLVHGADREMDQRGGQGSGVRPHGHLDVLRVLQGHDRDEPRDAGGLLPLSDHPRCGPANCSYRRGIRMRGREDPGEVEVGSYTYTWFSVFSIALQ